MGALISGAGTSTIEIEGVSDLQGVNYSIINDRIEAGTHLIGAAITAGDVACLGANPEHLTAVLAKLEEAGATVHIQDDGIRVVGPDRPIACDLTTGFYPGFPTDLQAQFMSLMCVSKGTSVITETIWENRFMHVSELCRLGADIRLDGRVATVLGVEELSGAPIMASDLRASAALVLAGLVAKNTTEVLRVYHIDRGYESIEEKLSSLGARIQRQPQE
jgi:UDP-N-acetylglucosamine 1-carboxyvinyltransferase